MSYQRRQEIDAIREETRREMYEIAKKKKNNANQR
jgi:hypothetical protein